MRPQDLLRFHPFVEALRKGAAEELLKHAITHRFEANDVIFREGDAGTGLYGVVSCRVVVTARSAEGKELFLNGFGAGEFFREIALLDGEGRRASAIACEPSELLFLDRQHGEIPMRPPHQVLQRIAVAPGTSRATGTAPQSGLATAARSTSRANASAWPSGSCRPRRR